MTMGWELASLVALRQRRRSHEGFCELFMFCNERGRSTVGVTLGPDLTPASVFYVHIRKGTEAVTKPQHRALQEHPPRRERTPSTQGEGWGGGAPTRYLHPSFEHHPALLSAGWEAGKNTPKNQATPGAALWSMQDTETGHNNPSRSPLRHLSSFPWSWAASPQTAGQRPLFAHPQHCPKKAAQDRAATVSRSWCGHQPPPVVE